MGAWGCRDPSILLPWGSPADTPCLLFRDPKAPGCPPHCALPMSRIGETKAGQGVLPELGPQCLPPAMAQHPWVPHGTAGGPKCSYPGTEQHSWVPYGTALCPEHSLSAGAAPWGAPGTAPTRHPSPAPAPAAPPRRAAASGAAPTGTTEAGQLKSQARRGAGTPGPWYSPQRWHQLTNYW